MNSDIHQLITGNLNHVISRLRRHSEADSKSNFKVQVYGGSQRYRKTSTKAYPLTQWMEAARDKIMSDFSEEDVEDVEPVLRYAYLRTLEYAMIQGKDKAVQDILEFSENLDEEYDALAFHDGLEELHESASTVELGSNLDGTVHHPQYVLYRQEDLDGAETTEKLLRFKGRRDVTLPAGTYRLKGKVAGVTEEKTFNPDETDSAHVDFSKEEIEQSEEENETQEEHTVSHPAAKRPVSYTTNILARMKAQKKQVLIVLGAVALGYYLLFGGGLDAVNTMSGAAAPMLMNATEDANMSAILSVDDSEQLASDISTYLPGELGMMVSDYCPREDEIINEFQDSRVISTTFDKEDLIGYRLRTSNEFPRIRNWEVDFNYENTAYLDCRRGTEEGEYYEGYYCSPKDKSDIRAIFEQVDSANNFLFASARTAALSELENLEFDEFTVTIQNIERDEEGRLKTGERYKVQRFIFDRNQELQDMRCARVS